MPILPHVGASSMPFLPAPGPPKNKYPSPYSPLFTELPRRRVFSETGLPAYDVLGTLGGIKRAGV
jgi:hypothetical protein